FLLIAMVLTCATAVFKYKLILLRHRRARMDMDSASAGRRARHNGTDHHSG
ncbi:hypothetical protein A2U01_0062090, partial [Trifolium medium]|nr:hypothetical protein [Trifolium medium]